VRRHRRLGWFLPTVNVNVVEIRTAVQKLAHVAPEVRGAREDRTIVRRVWRDGSNVPEEGDVGIHAHDHDSVVPAAGHMLNAVIDQSIDQAWNLLVDQVPMT
jgi:hypothetical protein